MIVLKKISSFPTLMSDENVEDIYNSDSEINISDEDK